MSLRLEEVYLIYFCLVFLLAPSFDYVLRLLLLSLMMLFFVITAVLRRRHVAMRKLLRVIPGFFKAS